MAIKTLIDSSSEDAKVISTKVSGTKVSAKSGWTKVSGVKKQVYGKGIPDNMIFFFTSTSAPDGTALCDGNSGTANLHNLYLRGGSSEGTSTGSNTHQHNAFSGSTGGDSPRVGSSGVFNATKAPTHTHTYNHTHAAIDHQPSYYTIKPGAVIGANSLPSGIILYYCVSGAPSAWAEWTTALNRWFKCNTSTAGSTGGGSHSHAFSGNSSSVGASDQSGTCCTSVPNSSHHHSISHTHSAYTNIPPSIQLRTIVTTEMIYSIPKDVVAFFLSDKVPFDWEYYSVAEGKFIRNVSTVNLDSYGTETHTHGSQSFSTGATAHTVANNAGTSGTSYPAASHSHGMNHGHTDSKSNVPQHIQLLICRKAN